MSLLLEETCSACLAVSANSGDFHADGRRSAGLHVPITCNQCWDASQRNRRRNNKRRLRAKNPSKIRANYRRWQLKKTYGITVEQYESMLTEQGGCCAICGSDNPGWSKDWHVDHCHSTGTVRGILCTKCNLLIGHADDRPDRLVAAANYLKGPNYQPPNLEQFLQ